MTDKVSPRLAAIVHALPLRPGMRILEIGCGPGVAARAVLRRISEGYVLGIDRSAKAVAQARVGSAVELASKRLSFAASQSKISYWQRVSAPTISRSPCGSARSTAGIRLKGA